MKNFEVKFTKEIVAEITLDFNVCVDTLGGSIAVKRAFIEQHPEFSDCRFETHTDCSTNLYTLSFYRTSNIKFVES